jgi:hypothetical protein
MKKEITTIKLSKKIVEELSKLKIHPRQAYEEVIIKLLSSYKGGSFNYSYSKGEITTIKLSKKVVEELSKLKIHPRQAYEEVIVKLLSLQNE